MTIGTLGTYNIYRYSKGSSPFFLKLVFAHYFFFCYLYLITMLALIYNVSIKKFLITYFFHSKRVIKNHLESSTSEHNMP